MSAPWQGARRALLALGAAAVLGALPPGSAAQSGPYSLRAYSRVDGIPGIGTVTGQMESILAGASINPFRYDCVANLEVVDATGTQLALDALDPSQVKILSAGQARLVREAEIVALRDGNRRIIVRLSMDGDPARVALRLEGARLQGAAPDALLPDLQSDELDIPEEVRTRCGESPRVNVDVQDPITGQGLGLNVDVVRRFPFDVGNGGLWELSLSGAALSGGDAVTLDTWRGEARVQWKLGSSVEHWVAFGVLGRGEASEDLNTMDGSLGASMKWRLDFLDVNELLRLVGLSSLSSSRFTPYPFLVAEYHLASALRTPDPTDPLQSSDRDVNDRFEVRLDWRVPFAFDTTVDVALRAVRLTGDVQLPGAPRWNTVRDVSVEYPVTGAGDVVAVLTWLDGSAAPLFNEASRYLMGIGIRR